MLCSDGVLEQMEDDNIKYIFSDKVGGPEAKVDMLIQVTSQNHDNHTAILVRINDVIDPIPVPPQPLLCEVESDEAPLSPESDSMNPASEQTAVPNMRKNGKKTIIAIVAAAVVTCLLVLVLMLVFGRDDKESAPEEDKKVQVNPKEKVQVKKKKPTRRDFGESRDNRGDVDDNVGTYNIGEADLSIISTQISEISSEHGTPIPSIPTTVDTLRTADGSSDSSSVNNDETLKGTIVEKALKRGKEFIIGGNDPEANTGEEQDISTDNNSGEVQKDTADDNPEK